MKALFVCAGNTCRSPMLEYMFKSYLESEGVDGVEVASAGISEEKNVISPYATTVLSAHGIYCDEKRESQYCSADLIKSADYVIAVTEEIAVFLRKCYGAENVFSIRDIAGFDVSDPHGKGLEEYQKTYKILSEILPNIYKFIKS